jgi:acylphosphatase
MTDPAVKLVITGFVQGVGFRWFCLREAQARELTGWVRNCPNGSVECEAHGDRTTLLDFIAILRHGTANARVDRVEEHWLTNPEPYTSFEIRQ